MESCDFDSRWKWKWKLKRSCYLEMKMLMIDRLRHSLRMGIISKERKDEQIDGNAYLQLLYWLTLTHFF